VRRKVIVSRRAAHALKLARAWLLQSGSGEFGRRRWVTLAQTVNRLKDHPYLGGPAHGAPGARVLIVSGYRLIYTVTPDTGDNVTAGDILIVKVFGPGQDDPGQP
jgi:plasmid stabilization system protein ParE